MLCWIWGSWDAAIYRPLRRQWGATLAEAGCVCLESQGHSSGATLTVRGYAEDSYTITWSPASEQARNLAYNDAGKTTEMGAEGIAVLIARAVIGYEVIRRSRRGDGFDYWLGAWAETEFIAQAGLEVSGIRNGSDRQIRARVREKRLQANQGGRQRWATYVIVVEFSRPLAEVNENAL